MSICSVLIRVLFLSVIFDLCKMTPYTRGGQHMARGRYPAPGDLAPALDMSYFSIVPGTWEPYIRPYVNG